MNGISLEGIVIKFEIVNENGVLSLQSGDGNLVKVEKINYLKDNVNIEQLNSLEKTFFKKGRKVRVYCNEVNGEYMALNTFELYFGDNRFKFELRKEE